VRLKDHELKSCGDGMTPAGAGPLSGYAAASALQFAGTETCRAPYMQNTVDHQYSALKASERDCVLVYWFPNPVKSPQGIAVASFDADDEQQETTALKRCLHTQVTGKLIF